MVAGVDILDCNDVINYFKKKSIVFWIFNVVRGVLIVSVVIIRFCIGMIPLAV